MIIHQNDGEIYFKIFKDVAKQAFEDHSFIVPAGSKWCIRSYGLSAAADSEVRLIWDIGGDEEVIDSTQSSIRVNNIDLHDKFYEVEGDGVKQIGIRMSIRNSEYNTLFTGGFVRLVRLF